MKRTIITIITFSILIGFFAVTMNIAVGSHTSILISKYRLESGLYMYRFNWADYIRNLNLSITDVTYLKLEMPTRTWENNLTINNYIEGWTNNFALILDYIILAINVIIYPMRIGAYALKNLLVIIGINQDTDDIKNGLAWLIELTNWLMARIQIPYV